MVLPRASSMRGAFRHSTMRTNASSRIRSRFGQQIGRRSYASEHGSHKASSDLPWMIGAVAVTVPSATWLWQQGPKKGEGGHGHEEHEEHEEGGEEGSKDEGDEPKEEGEDKPEEGKEEDGDGDKKESEGGSKEESGDEKSADNADDSSSDEGDSKDTPSTSDDEGKSSGKGSKGERATEKKGEKDAQGSQSGAKHPYIDDPEKSKKGEGVTETAKIHGTVDSKREAR